MKPPASKFGVILFSDLLCQYWKYFLTSPKQQLIICKLSVKNERRYDQHCDPDYIIITSTHRSTDHDKYQNPACFDTEMPYSGNLLEQRNTSPTR